MQLIFLLLIQASYAQSLLEKPVTVRIQYQTVSRALEIIGETGGFSFSYSGGIIDGNRKISLNAENRPLKQVLTQILGPGYVYEQIGNHIIIKKSTSPTVKNSKPQKTKYEYVITGYIRDEQSGQNIMQASIFALNGAGSAISGDFGAFDLRFTLNQPETMIGVRREGYLDTNINVAWQTAPIKLNINIQPLKTEPENVLTEADSNSNPPADSGVQNISKIRSKPLNIPPLNLKALEESLLPIEKWFSAKSQRIHEVNVKDSIGRFAQFTFFPPAGSNGRLSPVFTNNISINLLAGNNGGLNGAEIGGLVNVLRRDMSGFQAAGLANVSRSSNGAQLAGVFNHVKGGVKGFQAAGVYNLSNGKGSGVQMAGVANMNGTDFNGVQLAGVSNTSGGNSEVLQIGGVVNYAKKIKGLQMAGFLNIADSVKGSQIGVINISRHTSGAAIGIINIIRDGYHQLETGSTDLQWAQIAWKSGTRKLYTIFGSGFSGFSSFNKPAWGYFAGLGTSIGYGRRFWLNLDLTAYELMYRKHAMNLSTAARFDVNLNFRLARGFHLSGGPALTIFGADTRLEEWTDYYSRFENRSFNVYKYQDYKVIGMVGWKMALRFF